MPISTIASHLNKAPAESSDGHTDPEKDAPTNISPNSTVQRRASAKPTTTIRPRKAPARINGSASAMNAITLAYRPACE